VRNDDDGTYEVNGLLLPRRGHLLLCNAQRNAEDMVQKGRARNKVFFGSDHPSAKWTEDDVREARMLRQQGWTLTRLAARYGVSITTVHRAVLGITWPHIS
jgi:hypothetical protein